MGKGDAVSHASKTLLLALALLLAMGACMAMPQAAQAETWNHRAAVTLPDKGKSRFVQGAAYDGTRYCCVVKQNVSKHQTLWRADMTKGGKAKRMTVSAKARKAIHHGNDMAFVRAGGKGYLLVAPCKAKSHRLVVLRVSGTKATYHKSVTLRFTPKVSAITVVSQNGSKLRVMTGYGKHLWMADVSLSTGKARSLGRVYGYVSNQGITYANGCLYTCDGGYTTRLGKVRKYQVVRNGNHWNLRRVWVRSVKGEPETAFVDKNGKVCVALEGKWHWRYSDRITRWVR